MLDLFCGFTVGIIIFINFT